VLVQLSDSRGGGPQRPPSSLARSAGSGAASPGGSSAPELPLAARMSVRPATIRDMKEVAPLINRFAGRNLMLAKTDDQLVRSFREFLVAVDPEGSVMACGALRIYSQDLAEIVSLAVDEAYHGAGIGRQIVEGLLDDARALGIRTVFALTLQEGFFLRLGFSIVPKELFPVKVWADCRSCPKLHACDETAVARQLV
jgi:amino-acid N-acetyltransferase